MDKVLFLWICIWASQVALVVKEPACQCRLDIRNMGSIPGSGKSPEGGHGNPVQYSCLENPMGIGTWQAVAYGSHRVGHNWSNLTQHVCICTMNNHPEKFLTHHVERICILITLPINLRSSQGQRFCFWIPASLVLVWCKSELMVSRSVNVFWTKL